MDMTRREFVAGLGAVAVALLSGAAWLAERTGILRVTQAVRTRAFPGRVRPLSRTDVQTPGRWAG